MLLNDKYKHLILLLLHLILLHISYMKNVFLLSILLTFLSCQSTKIKKETYKVSTSVPELGAIGESVSSFNQNTFDSRTLAKLENNIRVEIDIVPFNLKLDRIYKSKAKYNQSQSKIVFIDSLSVKPELVTIKILDVTGFVNELNATYNSDVFKLLTDTNESKIVSSLALNLSIDDLAKIRQADSYYLINLQERKYTIGLYKSGKKTDILEINPQAILAYQVSSFCWAISERGQWYIADMVKENKNCRGNTKSKINKKKKNESLFDM